MEQPIGAVSTPAALPPKQSASRDESSHAHARRPGGVSETSNAPDALGAAAPISSQLPLPAQAGASSVAPAIAGPRHASTFMPRNTLSLTPAELEQLTHVLTDSSRVKQELKEAEAMVEQMRRKIRELENNLARAHENVMGSGAGGENNGSVGTASASRDSNDTTDLSPAQGVAASTAASSSLSIGAAPANGAPGGSAGSGDSRSREGTSSVSQPGSSSGSGGDSTGAAATDAHAPSTRPGPQHAQSGHAALSAGAAPSHGQQVIQPPQHAWIAPGAAVPEWSHMPVPMDMSSSSLQAGASGSYRLPLHAETFAGAVAPNASSAGYMYSDAAGRPPVTYEQYQRHMLPWGHGIHAMTGAAARAAMSGPTVTSAAADAAAARGFDSGSKSDGQSSIDSDKQLAAYRVTVTAPSAALRAVDTRDIGPNGTSLAGHKRGRGGEDNMSGDGHHSPASNTSDSAGGSSGPTDASSGGGDSGAHGSTSTSLMPGSDASAGEPNTRSSGGNSGDGERTPPEHEGRGAASDLRVDGTGQAGMPGSPDMDGTEESAPQRRDVTASPSVGPAAARAPLVALMRHGSTAPTLRVHIRCASLGIHPMIADMRAPSLLEDGASQAGSAIGGVVVQEVFLPDGRRLLFDRDTGALYAHGQRLAASEVAMLEEIHLLPGWLSQSLRAPSSVVKSLLAHDASSIASSGPAWPPRPQLDFQRTGLAGMLPRASHITADIIADAAAASAAAAIAATAQPDLTHAAAERVPAESWPGDSIEPALAHAAEDSDDDMQLHDEDDAEESRARSGSRGRGARRKRPTLAAVEGMASAVGQAEGRSRESSATGGVSEDGAVTGKLVPWEKLRMEQVLDSIRRRALYVARGELAQTLQQQVNPARRRAFYEKYISRHKLNQTLIDLLGPPRPRTAAHQHMHDSDRMQVAAALKRAAAPISLPPSSVDLSSCPAIPASSSWLPIASDAASSTVVLGRMLNSLAASYTIPATSQAAAHAAAARFATFAPQPFTPLPQLPADYRPPPFAVAPQMPEGVYGMPTSTLPMLNAMNTAFRVGASVPPGIPSAAMPTTLAFAAPLGAPVYDASYKSLPSPPVIAAPGYPLVVTGSLPMQLQSPAPEMPTMNPWMLTAMHDASAGRGGVPTTSSIAERASALTRRLAGLDTDIDTSRDVTAVPYHAGLRADGFPQPYMYNQQQPRDAVL